MTEEKLRLFYLLIIVIASMVLAIIYSKTNENIGNKREVRAFKGMLISFMIYTLVKTMHCTLTYNFCQLY